MLFKKGLLSAAELDRSQLFSFFELCLKPIPDKTKSKPTSAVGVLAFFESSSRTRVSFEKAGLDLGVRWIHLNPDDLSLKKNESLEETFRVMAHYGADFWVVRSKEIGLSSWAQFYTDRPVFNAGDGACEHPSQALLDALCLFELNQKKKWSIAFFGDIEHSRVFRSDVRVFQALGYRCFVVDNQLPLRAEMAEAFGCELIARKHLNRVDAVQCLRVQAERGSKVLMPPLRLNELGAKTLIMHPGPVMLGQDMLPEVYLSPRSRIMRQVELGYRVRFEMLKECLRANRL